MRARALPMTLLFTASLATSPGIVGCDAPGGGVQSGDVTSYGADAGGVPPSSDENLFTRLMGTGGSGTEPACVGGDCTPAPDPGPEPVCEAPLPPSMAVATQCQTLCQKLVACTSSSGLAQGPCVSECTRSMTAVAPDVVAAAMGCYMAASCGDIQAAMVGDSPDQTEPAPAPGYPTDMDAGSSYAGGDSAGAPRVPPEDPVPAPQPTEDTALQQCLDSAMQGIMESPLEGADQAFCDAMTTKQQACFGADRPVPDPQPGADGTDGTPAGADAGFESDSWYCAIMAHLLSDPARDMVGACYALPCDQVQACVDGLDACLRLPIGSSANGTSGSGSSGTGTAEPSPAR